MVMEHNEKKTRVGISAQTSVGDVTATTGGHGEEKSSRRVASGHTSTLVGAGQGGCNATASCSGMGAGSVVSKATAKHALTRSGAAVDLDSDLDSLISVATAEEDRLLLTPERSTGACSTKAGPRILKRSKEGLKAKTEYKAALNIVQRLEGSDRLSPAEKERLAWATKKVEEGRAFYVSNPRFASTSQYANIVEENAAKKRQRSKDGAKVEAPGSKRQKPSSTIE